jgi:hypothetical protein
MDIGRAEGPATLQPMAAPWAVERISGERAEGPMHGTDHYYERIRS